MSHMYYSTLITVAPDYSGEPGKVPKQRGGKPTVATMQFEMLRDDPFHHTQEDVLFDVWRIRQGHVDLAPDELAAMRDEFFSTGRACMRASPLTKSHGWGVLFDTDGCAALVAMDSPEYAAAVDDPQVAVVAAMRSKRA